MAVAPLLCTCGAPIALLHEVPDREADGGRPVMVGILECRAGHPWIDIRPIKVPRPHPWALGRPKQLALPFGGLHDGP
jgi:hypothetical protein